jgi:hypothetical protein
MTHHNQIKTFIQQTLGCGCPEEVFRTIVRRDSVRLKENVVVTTVLTIGDRLLVYVVGQIAQEDIQQQIPILMAAGKQERDARGLNRFRLVVFTDDPAEEQPLKEAFEQAAGLDEKLHLHVLSGEKNIF